MANQKITITRTSAQNSLLDLEKTYYQKLESIILSKKTTPAGINGFQDDLLKIEYEIKLNYSKLASTWNIKNKIKVAAERLVRHHIYLNMHNDIKGIYESPLSSDLGVELDDCILCVDCKTLDTKNNSTDISYTSVEANQISFNNKNHRYIKAASNLEQRARASRKPVLTYIIKIIYHDDNVNFDISRTTNIGKKPSIVLTCIPNGELSNLFGYDLIQNFKTYKYYSKEDGKQYTPVDVPKVLPAGQTPRQWAENYCITQGYSKTSIPQVRGTKDVFWDAANGCYWVYTSENNQKKIRAIKRGDSMRLSNKSLKKRFDSKDNPWSGYTEYDL